MPPYSYTVKQGDTLNSIVQRLGFANYKEAGISSVPSGNFDLIKPGEQIAIPNYKPVQQTTTDLRMKAAENGPKLDNRIAQVSGAGTTTTDTSTTGTGTSGANGVNMNEATARELFGTDFTGVIKNADGTFSADTSAMARIKGAPGGSTLDKDIQGARDKASADAKYATDTLDSIKTISTAATHALIESIKKTYGARIELMEDSNKRLKATKKQAGYRSGRSRYTNELQAGILSDEEQKGLARVGQLEGTMLQLISEAEQARTNKDLELFNSRMSALDKIDDNLRSEVQSLQKTANDKLTALRDAAKFDMDKEKAELDMAIKSSEAAAPAIASAIEGMSAEDQLAFFDAYEQKTGTPAEYLVGAVLKYQKDARKDTLDLENIENQIKNRDASTAISAERLKLDKKKADFNPTAEQKAKVGKYIAKNGTDDDATRVNDDPDFFYYILDKAEAEEL